MGRSYELAHLDLTGLRRHVISVDSRFRENPTMTDPNLYRFTLPTTVRNIKVARLLTTEIPNTQYVVNESNKYVDFFHKFDAAYPEPEQTVTAVLEEGTYSATEFATELNKAMNWAVKLGGVGFAPDARYTVVYNSILQKFVISRPIGLFRFLWLNGAHTKNSAYELMGFDKTYDTAEASIHQSPFIINLAGENLVYLCIAGMAAVQAPHTSNVFAKIIWDQPPRATCFDSFASNPVVFKEPLDRLDRLDIEFRQPDGSLYDFNNSEHSFTIELYSTV